MNPKFSERVIIVSGPSGAGKTTVMREVFKNPPIPMVASVSATTRPPRRGEVNGKDYYFMSDEEFQTHRQMDDFLECFQVFEKGCWYGTLWKELNNGFKDQKWVLLEIDVQGALAVIKRFPAAISFFIRPGSVNEIERRMRDRGTESEEEIQLRLRRAEEELTYAQQYHYQVINDKVENAVKDICNILKQEWEKVQND